MVAVPGDGFMCPQHHRTGKGWIGGQVSPISHGYLVEHVHPHFVAQIKKAGCRRAVHHADGVDIGLLHQAQIFQPVLTPRGDAHLGMLIVPADSPELDGLPVQALHPARG